MCWTQFVLREPVSLRFDRMPENELNAKELFLVERFCFDTLSWWENGHTVKARGLEYSPWVLASSET